jgi:hypothetical protein
MGGTPNNLKHDWCGCGDGRDVGVVVVAVVVMAVVVETGGVVVTVVVE